VQDPRKEALLALLVDFDDYDGPEYTMDPVTGRKLVPIFRSTRDFVRGAVTCTRTQFPVTEAYAVTIHKSQGISVNQICVNLSGKADFTPGLTYVALSRVRSLKGLLVEEPFTLERLRFKPSKFIIMRNSDINRRSKQEIPLPVSTQPDESGSDLPDFSSFYGTQVTLPIVLQSDRGEGSTVPVPTSERQVDMPSEFGLTLGGGPSDNMDLYED
jgi:hypothetical protein